MSHRTRNVVLVVLALFILLTAVSWMLFNAGESVPGSGEGDPLSGLSSP